MKLIFARMPAALVLLVVLGIAECAAQTTAPATAQTETQEQPVPHSGGKVVFSRSTDESGAVKTHVGPGATPTEIVAASEPVVDDGARLATAITALDLDVHLDLAAHQLAVRALVTVRNDGKAPLVRIPLQISSQLRWEQVRVGGKDVAISVSTLNSDSDHTGQLHEAAILLAEPLAPGASVKIDAVYSGEVTPTARRLTTLGAPEATALHNDWDGIAPEFTGLRGFGNVAWYPVASVPVILGDGARLFDEIGRQKLALSKTQFRVRVTAEFPHDEPPTVAVLNGQQAALNIQDAQGTNPGFPGVATASLDVAAIGFETPSIFLARRKAHSGPAVNAWTTEDNDINVEKWLDAARDVKPLLDRWLGVRPRGTLTLLDLPDPNDSPFETGTLLAAPLGNADGERLNRVMVHALAHAYTRVVNDPAPAWLSEGLARFMETVWVERRQGRDRALGMLEADRAALALEEPESPGKGVGQPLDEAIAPIYYRTKAAYVLWMLRDIVGEEALMTALTSYQPQPEETASATLTRLLRGAGVTRDLSWFFADWVDADKGLPDLSIANVFSTSGQTGSMLVAVDIANTGYASCEVPVSVRTAKGQQTERVQVPARGKAIQRILVLGKPTQAQVNDGTVPETGATVHITDLDATAPKAPAGGSSSQTEPEPHN
jgi:hypothetical protein